MGVLKHFVAGSIVAASINAATLPARANQTETYRLTQQERQQIITQGVAVDFGGRVRKALTPDAIPGMGLMARFMRRRQRTIVDGEGFETKTTEAAKLIEEEENQVAAAHEAVGEFEILPLSEIDKLGLGSETFEAGLLEGGQSSLVRIVRSESGEIFALTSEGILRTGAQSIRDMYKELTGHHGRAATPLQASLELPNATTGGTTVGTFFDFDSKVLQDIINPKEGAFGADLIEGQQDHVHAHSHEGIEIEGGTNSKRLKVQGGNFSADLYLHTHTVQLDPHATFATIGLTMGEPLRFFDIEIKNDVAFGFADMKGDPTQDQRYLTLRLASALKHDIEIDEHQLFTVAANLSAVLMPHISSITQQQTDTGLHIEQKQDGNAFPGEIHVPLQVGGSYSYFFENHDGQITAWSTLKAIPLMSEHDGRLNLPLELQGGVQVRHKLFDSYFGRAGLTAGSAALENFMGATIGLDDTEGKYGFSASYKHFTPNLSALGEYGLFEASASYTDTSLQNPVTYFIGTFFDTQRRNMIYLGLLVPFTTAHPLAGETHQRTGAETHNGPHAEHEHTPAPEEKLEHTPAQ